MKPFLPVGTAIAMGLLALQSHAASITTDSDAIAFTDTNWLTPPSPPDPLVLDLFDDLGGSRLLTKVTIVAEALGRGRVTLGNDSPTASTFFGFSSDDVNANITLSSTVGAVSVSLNPIASEDAGTHTIAPGDADVVIDFGGGITGAGASDTDTIEFTDAANLAEFIDPGATFSFDTLALGEITISQSGGDGRIGQNIQAAASVTVTYEWTPAAAPAPGVMLLLGSGLVGLLAARRRLAHA